MPIDFEHLGQYTGGDVLLETEVLDLFLGTVRETLDAMRTGPEVQSWGQAAHKLRGSALAVGAWRLADMADQAERATPDGEAAARLLSDLSIHVGELEAFINTRK